MSTATLTDSHLARLHELDVAEQGRERARLIKEMASLYDHNERLRAGLTHELVSADGAPYHASRDLERDLWSAHTRALRPDSTPAGIRADLDRLRPRLAALEKAAQEWEPVRPPDGPIRLTRLDVVLEDMERLDDAAFGFLHGTREGIRASSLDPRPQVASIRFEVAWALREASQMLRGGGDPLPYLQAEYARLRGQLEELRARLARVTVEQAPMPAWLVRQLTGQRPKVREEIVS
jgi:hypothetical protein